MLGWVGNGSWKGVSALLKIEPESNGRFPHDLVSLLMIPPSSFAIIGACIISSQESHILKDPCHWLNRVCVIRGFSICVLALHKLFQSCDYFLANTVSPEDSLSECPNCPLPFPWWLVRATADCRLSSVGQELSLFLTTVSCHLLTGSYGVAAHGEWPSAAVSACCWCQAYWIHRPLNISQFSLVLGCQGSSLLSPGI